jgi:hypothetical protein
MSKLVQPGGTRMWIRLVVVACTAAFCLLVHVISSTPAVDGPRQSLSTVTVAICSGSNRKAALSPCPKSSGVSGQIKHEYLAAGRFGALSKNVGGES